MGGAGLEAGRPVRRLRRSLREGELRTKAVERMELRNMNKVVELLSLTGWVSGVSGVTRMISFDSPNDPIKGLLFPFHR